MLWKIFSRRFYWGRGWSSPRPTKKKKLQKLKIKFPKKHLKPQFTFVSNAAGETSKPPREGFTLGLTNPPSLLQNTITILLVSVTIAGKDRARDLQSKKWWKQKSPRKVQPIRERGI